MNRPEDYKDKYYKNLREKFSEDTSIYDTKAEDIPEDTEKEQEDPTDKRKWEATESTISFNFCDLVKKVKTHLKKTYPENTPDEINAKIGKSIECFSINEQHFKYTASPNHLGGVRWYVLCPKCGKKSLKLYLPKNKDREPLYLCKSCHKLKPSSMLLGNRKKYKTITRPLKRMELIKKKLLRRRLTPKEAEALLEEYSALEKVLSGSPEYKLWKFKKEHGKGV